jgi:hypothetical protein
MLQEYLSPGLLSSAAKASIPKDLAGFMRIGFPARCRILFRAKASKSGDGNDGPVMRNERWFKMLFGIRLAFAPLALFGALLSPVGCLPVFAQEEAKPAEESDANKDSYYIVASIANLRAERTATSALVARLPIGTPVEILESRTAWTRIRKGETEGWLLSSLLMADKPTYDRLMLEYKKVRRTQLKERRKWAERVAAIAPDEPESLFPLIETLKELGDKEALKQVQVAQAQALVKKTWLSLDPRSPPFQLGVRALYTGWLKANIGYPIMIELAGLPVFRRGPHEDGRLHLTSPHDFGRYNPAFLTWLEENLLPVLEHPSFVTLARPRYKIFLEHIGRTYHKAHLRYANDRAFLKEQAKLYQKENEQRVLGMSESNVPFHKRYHLDPDQLVSGENAKHRSEALGFWLRRHLDGTFEQFGRLMVRLLGKYDSEILEKKEKGTD